MTQSRVCPVCPKCAPSVPRTTSSKCVPVCPSVSPSTRGDTDTDTLDRATKTPRVCPNTLASVGLPVGWLEEDDRRRALLMAAGKERLELRRNRRR
jgi:hypothetical protein